MVIVRLLDYSELSVTGNVLLPIIFIERPQVAQPLKVVLLRSGSISFIFSSRGGFPPISACVPLLTSLLSHAHLSAHLAHMPQPGV